MIWLAWQQCRWISTSSFQNNENFDCLNDTHYIKFACYIFCFWFASNALCRDSSSYGYTLTLKHWNHWTNSALLCLTVSLFWSNLIISLERNYSSYKPSSLSLIGVYIHSNTQYYMHSHTFKWSAQCLNCAFFPHRLPLVPLLPVSQFG